MRVFAWSLRALGLFLVALPWNSFAADFSATLDDGIGYRSSNGAFSLKVGGRLHLDSAHFIEDKRLLDDRSMVRRARLALRADLYQTWRLGVDYDLTDEARRFSLLWLRFSGFEKGAIVIGQFQEPFGLEELTSSNSAPFMERSLANTLMPGANVGIALQQKGRRWAASGGLFWDEYIEDSDLLSSGDGRGVTLRVTAAPLKRKGAVLHLGVSGSYRQPDERGRVRFRSRPESALTDYRFVDTGSIRNVNGYLSHGLELAAATGRFIVQGEYVATTLRRERGRDDETFSGGYLAASMVVSGKPRRYSAGSGLFRDVRRKNGQAWEVALRRSFIDLNGKNVQGGEQANTTWGVNWYPHNNVRLLFNYIQVDSDAVAGDDDPDIVQLRLQLTL